MVSRRTLAAGLVAILLAACTKKIDNPLAGGGGHATASVTAPGSTTSTSSSQGAGGTGTTSTASGTDTSLDKCNGVSCSGHGHCVTDTVLVQCACDPGFHAVNLTCAADQTCAGVDCGTCGMCEVQAGVATCTCPPDYQRQGNACVLAIDPCAGAGCQADEACVPEAHCQALGACVKTCDCSNCGNCGPDNSDGRWTDMQEYCGALPDQQPATKACTRPCPQGEGCIPYQPAICWPIEGCFSL
jgi:hypothetical protein